MWWSRLFAHLILFVGWGHTSVYNEESDPDLSKLQSFGWKPRIFILSDILNEPDDSMSLVRYLLFSNEFDTRGICATTSWWLQNGTHPEEMRKIINAYGEVVDNLNHHVSPSTPYQSAEELLSLVTSGPSVYGRAALHQPLSEGAERIILALKESEDPLFITVWGGANTLAQALLHMDNTMPPAEAAELRSRIRLYAISDQDDTGPWIRAHYPDIFYVVSIHAWNAYELATWSGIFFADCPCVNSSVVQNPWLDANIRLGPLGSQYPQIMYGMEGDTPMAPIDWPGGIDSNLFVDSPESVIGIDGQSYSTPQASIWRWRAAYQDDFAARIQWTLTSNFSAVGHPPVFDPDNPTDNSRLEFQWALYPDPTEFESEVKMEALESQPGSSGKLDFNDAGFTNVVLGTKVQITAPEPERNPSTGVFSGFHLLLQVTNRKGPYPIRRYMRVVCEYDI